MRRSPGSALLLLAACHHGPVAPAQDCTITRVADQADLARLAGCTRVAALTVKTAATLDWHALDALETIDGDLVIGPSLGLEDVELAHLRTIGGKLALASNNLMHTVAFRALETAGAIDVASNVALATLAFPHLARVAHDVSVTDGAALETLELPALVDVGGTVTIARLPELALLDLRPLPRTHLDALPKLPPSASPAPQEAD